MEKHFERVRPISLTEAATASLNLSAKVVVFWAETAATT
jgi:hypothetical protein